MCPELLLNSQPAFSLSQVLILQACTATLCLQFFSFKIKLSLHSLAYDVVEALPLLISWLSVRHMLRRLVPSDLYSYLGHHYVLLGFPLSPLLTAAV